MRNPKRKGLIPPLNLCLLAALSPPDVEVIITDENNATVDLNNRADLVGITSMTCTTPRMYALAQAFRERGVHVVLGGSHVSCLPEEGLEHADAVVVGEAEEVWPRLLEDFRRGKLERLYHSEDFPSVEKLPLPRRDLLKPNGYYQPNTVQTARGCPVGCSFCSVGRLSGSAFRFRPVDEVAREIALMKGRNILAFTDDNIMGNPARAKELFRALIPLKVIWGGQATLSAARDEELMALAYESGCRGLFIGIESISKESIDEMGKRINDPDQYLEDLRRIREQGIRVLGSFVFGFDHDDLDCFDRTVEFAIEAKLELAQFSILTPFPGTELYEKLEAEGRILTRDWWNYSEGSVVFQPAQMTPEELKAGQQGAWRKFYSNRSIVKRTLHFGPWFPVAYIANKFFSTINLAHVNPLLKFVQWGWHLFDREVRRQG